MKINSIRKIAPYVLVGLIAQNITLDFIQHNSNSPKEPPQNDITIFGTRGTISSVTTTGSGFLEISALKPSTELISTPKLDRNGNNYSAQIEFKI